MPTLIVVAALFVIGLVSFMPKAPTSSNATPTTTEAPTITLAPTNTPTPIPTFIFPTTKPNVYRVGATAVCRDGSYSYSQSRRGTCSHHGGVAQWL